MQMVDGGVIGEGRLSHSSQLWRGCSTLVPQIQQQELNRNYRGKTEGAEEGKRTKWSRKWTTVFAVTAGGGEEMRLMLRRTKELWRLKGAVGGLRSKDRSWWMSRKQNYGGEMGPNESGKWRNTWKKFGKQEMNVRVKMTLGREVIASPLARGCILSVNLLTKWAPAHFSTLCLWLLQVWYQTRIPIIFFKNTVFQQQMQKIPVHLLWLKQICRWATGNSDLIKQPWASLILRPTNRIKVNWQVQTMTSLSNIAARALHINPLAGGLSVWCHFHGAFRWRRRRLLNPNLLPVEGPLSNVCSLTVIWRSIRDSLQTIIQSWGCSCAWSLLTVS